MGFGKIDDRFWTDEKIRSYSDSGKLLAAYLLSNPHRNLIGCFRLPMEYICADLQWTADKAALALSEVCGGERPFAARDPQGWTVIIKFLQYEKFTSPNHYRAADFHLSRVPQTSPIFPILCQALAAVWRDEWYRRPKVLEATSEYLAGYSEATPKLPFSPAPPPPPPPAPIPIPKDSSIGDTVTASRVRASAAKLPKGWVPSSDQIAFAEKLGLVNGAVSREATKFEAYWTVGNGASTRRTEKGWNQTWINWITRAAENPRNSRSDGNGYAQGRSNQGASAGSGFAGLRAEARQAATRGSSDEN